MDDSASTWPATVSAPPPPPLLPPQQQQQQQQQPPRIRKRRRPAVACVRCRTRKIKCDREQPCSNCRGAKGDVECTYDPNGAHDPTEASPSRKAKKRPSSISHDASSTTMAWSPASVEAHRPNQNLGENRNGGLVPNGNAARPAFHDPGPAPHSNSDEEELMRRVDRLEGLIVPRSESQPSSTDYHLANPHHVQTGVREVVNKTRFFGRSHWGNTFQQFNAAAGVDPWQLVNDADLSNILDKCKTVGRDLKAFRFGKFSSLASDIAALIPSRETADKLVSYYFRAFESTHRVLHIPSFYREYAQFWSNALNGSVNQTFAIKLFLVMSIGACFDSEESSRLRAPQWIAIASSWLGVPSEKSRLNLSGVQIYCLHILSKQFNNISGDLTWIPAGSLLRVAMAMGYYRDPKHFPHMSVFQAEMRRRLWATVVELDLQSSLDAGMPPLLSVDDFDCGPPANIDDSDFDEDTKVAPKSKPDHIFTQCTTQLALLRSVKTRLSAVRLINSFHRERTDQQVMSLTEQLTSQLRAQSRRFENFAHQQPSNLSGWVPTKFHQNMLDVSTRRFLLSLLLPYSVSEKVEPRHFYFRKLAVECAMIFVSYFGDNLFSNITDDDSIRVRVSGGGALREIQIHSAIVIAMELVHSHHEDSSPASISEMTRQPLRKAFDDLIEQSHTRMLAGETNPKGYVYYSVIKTRLDALARNEDYRPKASAVAHRTAKEALEILRDRKEKVHAAIQKADADRLFSNAITSQEVQLPAVIPEYATLTDPSSTPDQNWMAHFPGTSMGDLMDMWPLFTWGDGELAM